MLTAVGRASLGRLVVRRIAYAAPLGASQRPLAVSAPRDSSFAARRSFVTSRWVATPAKRAAGAKSAKKKRTSAKKPKRKAKAKAKAAKPKTKKTKVLTPEQKARREAAKARAEIKELKAVALLSEPLRLPDTAWRVYVSHEIKAMTGMGDLGSKAKRASQTFRSLSDMELQRLQTTAEQNKLSNNAAYKAWVEGHPVEEIFEANRARASLSRKSKKKYRLIQDDRLPKKPPTSYSLFTKARWATGELGGESIGDAGKRVAKEWRELPQNEKMHYVNLAHTEASRYFTEVQALKDK